MLVVRMVVQTALFLLVLLAVLVVAAGDPAWPAAWAFTIELGLLSGALGAWLAWRDPELLAKRLGWGGGGEQAPWDRPFMMGLSAGFFLWLIVMGVDAQRLHVVVGRALNPA